MPRYINPENIKITAVALSDEDGTELVSLADVRRAIAQTPSEDVLPRAIAAECCDIAIHFKNATRNLENHIATKTMPKREATWQIKLKNPLTDDDSFIATCSSCGADYDDTTNFCPNCGAKMTVEG